MDSDSASAQALPRTRDVVTLTFGAVKEYSKLAGQIPADDYEYHLAFPGFRKQIRDDSKVLIDVMDKCCRLLPKRRRVSLEPAVDATGGPSSITETERIAVMEAVDSLLESVDSVLDELQGRKLHAADQLSITFGSELKAAAGSSGAAFPDTGRGGRAQLAQIMRPQLTFEVAPDNFSPFVPVYYDAQGVRHTGEAGVHPFAVQIKAFTTPQEQLLPHTELPYPALSESPLRFVDTTEDLQEVAALLLREREIAVDLEHHDFYSYQGFTCLMQISTRTADFMVDCLQVRSSMHLLAPVFLHPGILKVLHGAREDVRWLQKDFGLYLINFFDTGLALQTLHMPYSLAFAVDHFCQVKLNKKYQTADWRVRPLSAEMVHYARQDTHFLLYVYDRLKALLLNSESRASVGNLLVHVYNESRRLSLEAYEKPALNPDETYKYAFGRSLGGLNTTQTRVVRDVFNWRDTAAREADDSPPAVLHLSSVLTIASKLPTSATELLRCCSPVSVVVRTNVGYLVGLVRAALAETGVAEVAGDAAASAANATGHPSALASRATGVHRPMTGTMPSISSRVGPSLPEAATPEEVGRLLRGGQPSLWFTSMKRLSAILAARPTHHVPLPGSDVTARVAAAAERQAAAAAKATTSAGDLSPPPPPPPAATVSEDDNEDTQTKAPEEAMQAEPSGKGSKLAELEGSAISLRQAYGTGAQNRKKTGGRSTGKHE